MAMSRILGFAIFLAMLACPAQSSETSAKSSEVAPALKKVTDMLKAMLVAMQKDQTEDEEIYNKLACWCDTGEKEKAKSIATYEKDIEHLTSSVEELTANSARLTEEIKNLKKEKKESEESLDEATSLRRKELAGFNVEEKDLVETITSLKAALAVLSKHHSSFLQIPRGQSIAASLKRQLEKHYQVWDTVLSPEQRKALTSFIQAPSYNVQSGQIYGILEQMLETFERDLAASQKEDGDGNAQYGDLKKAKESELAAGTDQIETKTQELAASDEKKAQANEDLEDAKVMLAADEEYLVNLKDKCSFGDREWEERQKTRAAEMEAVAKALEILTSEDSHFLFSRTFTTAFVQKDTSMHSARRAQASKVIAAIAKKMHNPRLATLSVTIRLDAFARVKKAIDDMVAELMKEKKDEISHKDWCVKEFNLNEEETLTKEQDKTDKEGEIATTNADIEKATADIEKTTKEIAELQKEMKMAGQDREKANNEFQVIVADQRETQKVIKSALKVLVDWYSGAFVQQGQEPAAMQDSNTYAEEKYVAGPAAPEGFEDYKDAEGSKTVMKMMKKLIDEAAALEAETIRSEEDSQKFYEDFVKESNKSLEGKKKHLINKKADLADSEKKLLEAQKAHDNIVLELEQLANYKGELHSSCDYILKNFEVRQTARDEEIAALKQAKDILSGAKFVQMLENP